MRPWKDASDHICYNVIRHQASPDYYASAADLKALYSQLTSEKKVRDSQILKIL